MRDARKALGLSQDDIARQLRISRVTVSQWENNETLPRGHRLTALSAALHVPESVLKQFGLGGAKEVAQSLSAAYLPMVNWSDLTQFLSGAGVDMRHVPRVAIDGVTDESAFVIEMLDSSMVAGTPDDIAPGERLIISRAETPRPGDIVLGMVQTQDGSELVIRDYRPRAGGVFDLVPRSPQYETLSSIGHQRSITISGVVIEHHRKLRRR